MDTRKPYKTDLTDEQWEAIAPLLEASLPAPTAWGGRPRTTSLREVMNTLLYQVKTGCQWDMLPNDLVPKSTAFRYFERWRDDGTWSRVVDHLTRRVRGEAGQAPEPTTIIAIDSQTVKTGQKGGPEATMEGRR